MKEIKAKPFIKGMKNFLIVVLIAISFTACSDRGDNKNSIVNPIPPDTISTWTAGIVHDSTRIPPEAYSLVEDVRTARHEDFDRIVFEFSTPGIPGFHIEYVDSPVYECGSGKPLKVQGDGWLMIKFLAARMHKEGKSTIPKRHLKPDLPVILQLDTSCDFENYVTWIVSVESPNRFQVLALNNPARLVVDIKH